MKNRFELVSFAAKLAGQIKMHTRSNFNDLSTAQESSLLPLINHAWGEQFENMNRISQNFPGFDYGQPGKRLGLQMTATVAKKKYQDTLEKLRNNKELKGKFDKVGFSYLRLNAYLIMFVNTLTIFAVSIIRYMTWSKWSWRSL